MPGISALHPSKPNRFSLGYQGLSPVQPLPRSVLTSQPWTCVYEMTCAQGGEGVTRASNRKPSCARFRLTKHEPKTENRAVGAWGAM